jgi:hypothetical protein
MYDGAARTRLDLFGGRLVSSRYADPGSPAGAELYTCSSVRQLYDRPAGAGVDLCWRRLVPAGYGPPGERSPGDRGGCRGAGVHSLRLHDDPAWAGLDVSGRRLAAPRYVARACGNTRFVRDAGSGRSW